MRTTRAIVVTALGVLALLAAGCGDDDESPSTAAPTLTAEAPATTAAEPVPTTDAPATEEAEATGGDTAATTEAEAPTSQALGAEDPDSTAGTITDTDKAAFVAQADAVCKTYEDAIDALGEPQTAADLPIFISQAVALQEAQLAGLQGLTPPAGDEAFWSDLLGNVEEILDIAKELEAAAASGADEDALGAIVQKGEGVSSEADEQAETYGFEICGG